MGGLPHQPLRMAVLADDAKEAVLEHAAAQVIVEFRADILRQRAVFRRKAGEEVG